MTQDIVEWLRHRADVHLRLQTEGEKAEPWPELFAEAADTIAALRAEVARLTAERDQGARDYCDLMDRHDAHFVAWQSAKARADAAFAAGVEAAAKVADEYASMNYCAMNYPEEAGMAASATAYEVAAAIRALAPVKGDTDDRS